MPKSEKTVLRGEARNPTAGLRVGSASEGGSLGENLDLPEPWGGINQTGIGLKTSFSQPHQTEY